MTLQNRPTPVVWAWLILGSLLSARATEGDPMLAIVTDSTCDLRADELATLKVHSVPLYVNFQGKVHRDWVDIDPAKIIAGVQAGAREVLVDHRAGDVHRARALGDEDRVVAILDHARGAALKRERALHDDRPFATQLRGIEREHGGDRPQRLVVGPGHASGDPDRAADRGDPRQSPMEVPVHAPTVPRRPARRWTAPPRKPPGIHGPRPDSGKAR
jgi:hypothetical protein